MKLMLTSFGAGHQNFDDGSLFYQMPPVAARSPEGLLMPDYAALLLCEELVMDEQSFMRLQVNSNPLYSRVAKVFEVLRSEGLVTLVSFHSILSEHEYMLDMMLGHDLTVSEQWLAPLRESHALWTSLRSKLIDGMSDFPYIREHPESHFIAHSLLSKSQNAELQRGWSRSVGHTYLSPDELDDTQVLYGKRKRLDASGKKALNNILPQYLRYVNANIVLSNELGLGFHDWSDFQPFYRHKFLSVGRTGSGAEKQIEASHKLFEVVFPDFAITDAKTLIRVLRDKRVEDLRQLVQDAAEGHIQFDAEFARRTLMEVVNRERKTGRFRNIVSYATLPLSLLDFISPVPGLGTVTQAATDRTIGAVGEKRLKSDYKWFYLLSDVIQPKR